MNDDEFRDLMERCLAEVHSRQYRIAELLISDAHIIDLDRGVIEFSVGGDLFFEAAVVLVGSWAPGSGSWQWAWANQSLTPKLRVEPARIKELARTTGRAEFMSEATFQATEQEARGFAALARRHLGGIGTYTTSVDDTEWLFVVQKVTHHKSIAETLDRAERVVSESLLEARGPLLLNLLRERFPDLRVNLIGADLRGTVNPWAHDLHVQILFDYDRLPTHAPHDLTGANLSLARLDNVILRGVMLNGASLDGASLVDADLSGTDLRAASLRDAFLNGVNFARANLQDADFTGAELSRTLLADVDLSKVKGLNDVHHLTPSEISFSTLVASDFEIEVEFLRQAGVSRGLIQDLINGKRLESTFQTCFLSYSSKDEAFANQLHGSLTKAGVRVFWDRFDVIPGEFLEAQIAEAIREHKRLIVVLSPASMASDWVAREIQLAWAHKRESLVPIRLCRIEDVRQWTDALDGFPDLANIFPIQDFTAWKDPAQYRHAVSMLLKSLAGGVASAPD